jgi:hypothetical protein
LFGAAFAGPQGEQQPAANKMKQSLGGHQEK